MIPCIILSFFSDTAAVFEDREVFDSIRSSIETGEHEPVAGHRVPGYLRSNRFRDSLRPDGRSGKHACIPSSNPSPIIPKRRSRHSPGPDRGPDRPGRDMDHRGILFIACLILVPVLFTYKACFFKTRRQDGRHPAGDGEYRQQGPMVQILKYRNPERCKLMRGIRADTPRSFFRLHFMNIKRQPPQHRPR